MLQYYKILQIICLIQICLGIQVKFQSEDGRGCLAPKEATDFQEGSVLEVHYEHCSVRKYQVWEVANITGGDTLIYSLIQPNQAAIKVVTFDSTPEFDIFNITARTFDPEENQLWYLRNVGPGLERHQIVNKETGYCIGRRFTSSPFGVNISPCDEDNTNIWLMFRLEKYFNTEVLDPSNQRVEQLNVSIINDYNHKCLSQGIDGRPAWWDCNYTNRTTLWQIGTWNDVKNGTTITMLDEPKLALTQNGTTLFLRKLLNPGDEDADILNQQWTFLRESRGYIGNEVGYIIRSKSTPNLCIQDLATFLRPCGGNYKFVFKELQS